MNSYWKQDGNKQGIPLLKSQKQKTKKRNKSKNKNKQTNKQKKQNHHHTIPPPPPHPPSPSFLRGSCAVLTEFTTFTPIGFPHTKPNLIWLPPRKCFFFFDAFHLLVCTRTVSKYILDKSACSVEQGNLPENSLSAKSCVAVTRKTHQGNLFTLYTRTTKLVQELLVATSFRLTSLTYLKLSSELS